VAIQDALAFLRDARHDDSLGRQLETLDEVTWESLVEIAARAGFSFTSEELQRAHALDWRMRWARYRG
jgi:predicted ribosomally synthesized peptide with nif11-like leader